MRGLDWVFFICYSLLFQKNIKKVEILALINSENEINTINAVYAAELDLQGQKTNVNTHKIDSSSLKPYSIVIAAF